jgi:hypothetical protein
MSKPLFTKSLVTDEPVQYGYITDSSHTLLSSFRPDQVIMGNMESIIKENFVPNQTPQQRKLALHETRRLILSKFTDLKDSFTQDPNSVTNQHLHSDKVSQCFPDNFSALKTYLDHIIKKSYPSYRNQLVQPWTPWRSVDDYSGFLLELERSL